MLIDAAHPEETRVAVVQGDRLIDYDVEVASRRQLKGNIYLAKVTRVEPSLQAAFVEYGGNRHGFLAFSEIHPDYYQIPVADREALLAEQAVRRAAEEAQPEGEGEAGVGDEGVESVGGLDEDELDVGRLRPPPRHYKIQEVVKRRQIMLVQVAKEERGTKGAALTTYLSLAGRYCVLMPNTTRGGGISRKITNAADRKRLKKIVSEFGVPEGMAAILRTAGAERSKAEIRRDYDYLIRLWNSIRDVTLTSMAPTLVYEEGSLVKRSIRDLYDREIDEILIEGEAAYRTAKDFMKLLIPSHARRVKLYEDRDLPLFQRYRVESELEAMHRPTVQLRSGGSIVINPTEALVAIDVNSGRATRERHIEETALRTNLEAADEIARQLRLRDLAGLIVVDFIDMENPRNRAQVERRLKEAMKVDRARAQVSRISAFGLLELSRQRLRPSLLETSFETCPFCAGMGVRRTRETLSLAILRRIEEQALGGSAAEIRVRTSVPVASYLLNQKRATLFDLERRYGVSVAIVGDAGIIAPDYEIERIGAPTAKPEAASQEPEQAEEKEETHAKPEAPVEDRGEGGRRGRQRRPRRRRRGEPAPAAAAAELRPSETEGVEPDEVGEVGEASEEAEVEFGETEAEAESADRAAKRRRRRGKRGGRRRLRKPLPEGAEAEGEAEPGADAETEAETEAIPPVAAAAEGTASAESDAPPAPAPQRFEWGAGQVEGMADQPEAGEPQTVEATEPMAAEPSVSAANPPAEPESMVASETAPRQRVNPAVSIDAWQQPIAESPSPAEPYREAAAEAAGPQPNGDETARTEAKRTVVIQVGVDTEPSGEEGRRKGWWQRFLGE
jgi:ribonuclease E